MGDQITQVQRMNKKTGVDTAVQVTAEERDNLHFLYNLVHKIVLSNGNTLKEHIAALELSGVIELDKDELSDMLHSQGVPHSQQHLDFVWNRMGGLNTRDATITCKSFSHLFKEKPITFVVDSEQFLVGGVSFLVERWHRLLQST